MRWRTKRFRWEADEVISLHDWFADPDGDDLTFDWEEVDNLYVDIDRYTGLVYLEPETDWNGILRLNFTAHEPDVIEEGIQRLAKAIKMKV